MASWMGVRLITSRSAPSAAVLTASSGFSTRNRNWPGSRIFQNTVLSASTMFSSPVSICPPRPVWASALPPASVLSTGEALLQHQPRPGPQLLALAFKLPTGGQNVAAARRADRARVAGVEDDLGEPFDRLPVRTFVGAARPGVEGNEVDL